MTELVRAARFCSFKCYALQPGLRSFPTRRSSDLGSPDRARHRAPFRSRRAILFAGLCGTARGLWRSEEHTSELQSQFQLVCRLLLEKKKVCPFLPRFSLTCINSACSVSSRSLEAL